MEVFLGSTYSGDLQTFSDLKVTVHAIQDLQFDERSSITLKTLQQLVHCIGRVGTEALQPQARESCVEVQVFSTPV